MANKLYEENSIADIADAIRSINGKKDTYTVSQMGDAIRSVRKVYTGTIAETILGYSAYTVLAKDSFLAEHRADENLFVRIEFDIEPTAHTVVKVWGQSESRAVFPVDFPQITLRYDGSTANNIRNSSLKFTDGSPDGVGSVLITEDGELRIYSESNNYAIRPSAYTVVVEI